MKKSSSCDFQVALQDAFQVALGDAVQDVIMSDLTEAVQS